MRDKETRNQIWSCFIFGPLLIFAGMIAYSSKMVNLTGLEDFMITGPWASLIGLIACFFGFFIVAVGFLALLKEK